jgi:hypothetical protein
MRTVRLALAAATLAPAALVAQSAAPKDSTPKTTASATPVNPIDFSGVIFGNFQYRGDKANKAVNKFELERSYLTFRMPAGDRAAIRITADIFQQQSTGADAYYKGWAFRAKYAYLNYTFLKNTDWRVDGRLGMIQNSVIEQQESFWPRYLSQVPTERNGYFSSADVGVATIVGLPSKMGELYAAVYNGPGYASRETDRFKDYSARLTLTPFANNNDIGFLKNLTLLGYYYKGNVASKFVAGGAGQVGAVAEGLSRDRMGIFGGLKGTSYTLAAEFNQRKDGGETGSNTTLAPRAAFDTTGRLAALYATVRPFQITNKNGLPLGIVARWDHVKPNVDTDPDYDIAIAGLTWDLTKKVQFALDYQEQTPHHGVSVGTTKTYYAHWIANF